VRGLLSRGRLLVVLSALALVAWSCAPGDVDLRFGKWGKVETDFGHASAEVHALLRQPDDKIVAVGYANAVTGNDFALARYNRDGSLDSTFGTGGTVTTNRTPFDEALAAALQPDGKILVAGTTYRNLGLAAAVARYNPDGSLDTTFGPGGVVINPLDGSRAYGVAVQPDGKVVIAGYVNRSPDFSLITSDIAVWRYNPDGTPDPGFGMQGTVIADVEGRDTVGYAVVLQRSGRIVVAGSLPGRGFALLGYLPNGTPDPGFGTAGVVTTAFPDPEGNGGSAIAYAVTKRWDDSLVVAGVSGTVGAGFGLARYSANGVLDARFGVGGTVVTNFDTATGVSEAHTVAIDRWGNIVAAGRDFSFTTSDDFLVARYRSDGRLDPRFGHGGRVVTDFFGEADHAHAAVVQPDGSIVVGGLIQHGARGEEFGLVRYFGRSFGSHRPHR
jgi:uncharacterized delta-60 repeat protein